MPSPFRRLAIIKAIFTFETADLNSWWLVQPNHSFSQVLQPWDSSPPYGCLSYNFSLHNVLQYLIFLPPHDMSHIYNFSSLNCQNHLLLLPHMSFHLHVSHSLYPWDPQHSSIHPHIECLQSPYIGFPVARYLYSLILSTGWFFT